jgi:acyl-CoA thioester hydrolase
LKEAEMLDAAGGTRPTSVDGIEPLFFTPFVSSVMRIEPGWIDYNGHLNMAYYNVLFDRAVDEAFLLCGMGPDYAKERGCSYFVVESRLRYRRELTRRDRVRITLQLIGVDDKRMRFVMEMRHAAEGWLAASAEHLALHVDMTTRKATPFPVDIREALESMRAAHSAMATPDWAGEGVAMRAKPATH